MPNSQRFEFHLKGKVPSERADALKAVLDAAVSGAIAGGELGPAATLILNLWHLLDIPTAVAAPSVYETGPGNDVILTPPAYTPEDEIEYFLMYSDDSGTTWTDVGYTPSPSTPITHTNGYNSGRIYSIFADDVAGTATTALA